MKIKDLAAIASAAASEPDMPDTKISRMEHRIERWGERLNPILVKEARQALKSRQFTVTFTLMLVAAWVWSILGILTRMPDIYYAPSGGVLLIGYYIILTVPLLLIVPFSAFRSLAAEREDLTYELLSITTLSSRQIVTGKLGSAVLQMIVYYSALAPCIAFTYLLRGVDIVSLLLLLAYTFGLSVLLSCAGLVFAGLARSRQWQSLMSVLLLLALIAVVFIWGWSVTAVMFLQGNAVIPLDDPSFWVVQAAVVTAWAMYVVILILVASAQNSFPSDNRSTRIRVAVCVQTILFIGWVAYGWMYIGDPGFLMAMNIFAFLHWYVYGMLMSGESAQMSPRVRRSLPRSFLGRTFLTWFNPGSGTGYVFTVSHLFIIAGMTLAAIFLLNVAGVPAASSTRSSEFADATLLATVLLAAYSTAYLGIARLLLLMIPHRERYGLALPVLINLLLLLLGCGIPYFYELARNRYVTADYGVLQASNWFWTLAEVLDNRSLDTPAVAIIVHATAVIVLIANLAKARREIESVRLEAPARVKLDDEARSRQDKAIPLETAASG